ncbi:MAG TPA: FadR/GntR family transcriptional regulator [Planctomycetota bacterium]|nr:FadR/GntR family transcriptional regulator [Planctomycetota bacterium]
MKRKGSVVTGVLGRLKPILTAGTRLPSERELSRKLRVSRPSLREALRTLELMGVVDTRHGSGTHVADSGTDVLKKPLEFLFMLDQPSIADLHDTRSLLEIHLAGRAAERRTDADLAALDAALREMKKKLPRPTDVTGPDLRFHQAIAAASHNRLLERLMNCLRDAISEMMNVAWPGQPDMNASYDLHVRVASAIRKKDVDGARRAMARHMEGMTDELRGVGLLP